MKRIRVAYMLKRMLLLLTLSLLLQAPVTYGLQTSRQDGESKDRGVRLVLHAPIKRLRSNQVLELVTYLENTTRDKTFLIGSSFSFEIISSYQNMLLTIMDEKNRKVGCPRMSATSVWELSKLTTEEVERAYVILSPGMIYGLKSKVNCNLKPGRYRVFTTYRDDFFGVWSQNRSIALKYPAWTQSLASNSVPVVIMP